MNRNLLHRCALTLATASALTASATQAATTSSWVNPVSGNWTDATNWSTNPIYPHNGTPSGATYDASIAANGSAYTISLSSSISLDSLTLNSAAATLNHFGTLNTPLINVQAGNYQLGGTLTGASVIAEDAARVNVVSGGITNPYLSSVYLDTDLFVQDGADLAMFNGTTMAPGRKIHMVGGGAKARFSAAFAGEILFENNSTTESKIGDSFGTNEIGAGVIARTAGGNMFIGGEGPTFTTNNAGLLAAETPGNKIHVYGSGHTFNHTGELRIANDSTLIMAARLVNSGAINVLGGTLELNTWTGTFGAINLSGGRLNLGAVFDATRLGTLNRIGGEVAVTGIFNNIATTHALTAALGPWVIGAGATITGGSIVPVAPGQPIGVPSGTFTINGSSIDADLALASGAALTLTGAWRNNGAIAGTLATVFFAGTFDTADIGSVTLTNSLIRYAGTTNNVGATLPIPSSDGNSVAIQSGAITGGTIGQPGQSLGVMGLSTLTATTLAADAALQPSSRLTIVNGLTLAGGARLEMVNPAPPPFPPPNGPSPSPVLEFTGGGNQTLGGSGEIVFGGGAANTATIRPAASSTLLIGAGVTIRTGPAGGAVGASGRSTINQGLISAQTAGQTITLLGSSTTRER